MTILLAAALFFQPAAAAMPVAERWTFSTFSGTATLALVPDDRSPPAILFMCGARLPGVAQVIISEAPEGLSESRLRLDLEVGGASATAGAERAMGLAGGASVMAEISVQQMRDLLRTHGTWLQWRVDAVSSVKRPQRLAELPHPLSRQRSDFLRHCI